MGKHVKKHGYSCKLVRVVDGDTADAMIDLGFNVWVKERIRFYGVDTWESRTRDLEEKKKGLAAKEFVKKLLENSDEGKFSIISHGTGKYGRVLGELFVKGNEQSVNELLKENGHAYEYHGEKKKGLEAKAYVKDLLENSDDGKFSIISHGKGKYGRVLGELFVKGHEKSVNELLKENGHAYEYHGEKKKVFNS